MFRYIISLVALLALLPLACTRSSETTANLGQEFSLAIGQSASLNGEDLVIRFVDVIGDSRCAAGVVCIWAGEASCLVEIDYANKTFEKVLTQPGLTEPAMTDFADYTIAFDLKPYPQAGQEIEDKDYRLDLDIARKSS